MKRIISLILIALLCVGLCSCGKVSPNTSNTADSNYYEYTGGEYGDDVSEPAFSEPATQVAEIDKSEITNVKMTVKNYGEIKLELYNNEAPITVANFVKLVNEGFYNGLTFHRIMQGFMIQGGDPEGTGMGGSDEEIKGEFIANGVANDISHIRGVISMARSSEMDSASSQFFICDADSTFLDGQYAAFGMVTEGMEVVDKIAADAVPVDDNGTIPAENQPVIEKIEVIK